MHLLVRPGHNIVPWSHSESAVFARAEQNVRGVLLEDAAMQGWRTLFGTVVIFLPKI